MDGWNTSFLLWPGLFSRAFAVSFIGSVFCQKLMGHVFFCNAGALSPPGRGYDCGRTWQVLALGSVP